MMRPAHFLLALAIVFIWGTNFIVIKEVLSTLPPLFFAALRFLIAFLPAAFFLPRPSVPLWQLAAYGVLIGVGQFGLLYIAMNGFITPGLASLVVQSQVFLTIGLAMYFSNERLRAFQIVALLLAAIGLSIIFTHTDGSTTTAGLWMVLLAALSWAAGNIINRHSAKTDPQLNMLSYVVWSSAFAVPILFALSFTLEDSSKMISAWHNMTALGWLGVAWQSVGNTLFGYAAWGWLLARYPAATVTPLALLIPVFGMGASALYLNEPLPAWKIIAAGMILAGMAINVLWPMMRKK